MERTVRTYLSLAKPGIVIGNGLAAAGGFALAAEGDAGLFACVLLGLSLVIASACAINNYLDRFLDAAMPRTRGRPLATGAVSPLNALSFAALLFLGGSFVLLRTAAIPAVLFAWGGFLMYVGVYSPLKSLSRHAALIGSLAGAAPPLVGYTAAGHPLDLSGLLLFAAAALWQMPHFFAIAIYRAEEYRAASIPVLPIARGVFSAKRQICAYMVLYGAAVAALGWEARLGIPYFALVLPATAGWLGLALSGFRRGVEDAVWAEKVFLASLAAVLAFNLGLLASSM